MFAACYHGRCSADAGSSAIVTVLYVAEVKITYAENAAMATQLYEVDVFMFFLKDLEAVTTNFYHDLWQSTRMHTPKVCRHRGCSSTNPWPQYMCACQCAAGALLSGA